MNQFDGSDEPEHKYSTLNLTVGDDSVAFRIHQRESILSRCLDEFPVAILFDRDAVPLVAERDYQLSLG